MVRSFIVTQIVCLDNKVQFIEKMVKFFKVAVTFLLIFSIDNPLLYTELGRFSLLK